MAMFVILMLLVVFQMYVIIYQKVYFTYVQFNVYQFYHHITVKHTHYTQTEERGDKLILNPRGHHE